MEYILLVRTVVLRVYIDNIALVLLDIYRHDTSLIPTFNSDYKNVYIRIIAKLLLDMGHEFHIAKIVDIDIDSLFGIRSKILRVDHN